MSIICLGFEINRLNAHNNLLAASATERNEFFFSDSTVPKPRPCTAMAWASLCAFGPIQGYIRPEQSFDLTRGKFLIPFLPKLLYDEDTSQSLIRSSRAHMKDVFGNIRWGSVYIADSYTGEVIEQLSHGQYTANEWMDERRADKGLLNRSAPQHEVPPLYATAVDGYQFGIIQNIRGFNLTLRDPMIELARHGIPELRFGGPEAPKINRLLIRFLNVADVRAWAQAYREAMTQAFNNEAVEADMELLNKQVMESVKQQILDATKTIQKKTPKYKQSPFAVEGFFNDIFNESP